MGKSRMAEDRFDIPIPRVSDSTALARERMGFSHVDSYLFSPQLVGNLRMATAWISCLFLDPR